MVAVLLVAFLSLGVATVVILVLAVIPVRLWRRAQRKGYRGPGVPMFLITVMTLMTLFGLVVAVEGFIGQDAKVPDIWLGPLTAAVLCGSVLFAIAFAAVVVLALPVRRHRPGGRRRIRFPYRFAGMVMMVLAVGLSLALLVFGQGPSRWTGPAKLGFAFGSAAYALFAMAKRAEKPDRDQAAFHDDDRPPVLYIRGFAQEMRYFAPRPAGPQEIGVGPLADAVAASQRNLATFEEFFEPTVRAELGPWCGLGNPSDHLPPRGILRFYHVDDDWQQEFMQLVDSAQCVIASPGAWPYLVWELDVIRKADAQQRLFVLTPPVADRRRTIANWALDTQLEAWQRFVDAATATEHGLHADYEFGPDPGPGAVVTFDKTARQVVLLRDARTPSEYVAAIRDRLQALNTPSAG
jgi:hypothetical protein